MPLIANVGDIIGLEPGTIVPGVKGIIVSTGKYSSFGEGTEKAGTVQTAFLKDLTSDTEIKVKFWSRADMAPMKGKTVTLIAKQGQKGLSGLKVIEDTYQDKSQPCLEVKESAEVVRQDGPPKKASAPAEEQDDIPGAESPRPAAVSRPSSVQDTWTDVGRYLDRIGALYAACMIQTVEKVVPIVELKTGEEFKNEETMHAIATHLSIQYLKDRGTGRLPAGPWKGYAMKADPKPTPEPPPPPPAPEPVEPAEDDAPF